MTSLMSGMTKKQIIIPSFKTTIKLFEEHLSILKELKRKIDLLKQAYYGQMDKKKTWEQVDEIIVVLKTGCQFLDFPEGKEIEDYMVLDEKTGEMRNYADVADQGTSPLSSSKLFLGKKAGQNQGHLRIETQGIPGAVED